MTAGYVLAELALSRIPQTARDLWNVTGAILVLLEPGTPGGFARIRTVRQALIEEGAYIAAPCTHDLDCPMASGDWCHFSERLARSRDHMIVKSASAPVEKEHYAYLAASCIPMAHNKTRIVRPPIERQPAILLSLCSGSGLHLKSVACRDKKQFRIARKKTWGDLF